MRAVCIIWKHLCHLYVSVESEDHICAWILFFKILFLIVCMSVVGMLPLGTKDNRVGGSGGGLELELPADVSHLTWALEAALGYS